MGISLNVQNKNLTEYSHSEVPQSKTKHDKKFWKSISLTTPKLEVCRAKRFFLTNDITKVSKDQLTKIDFEKSSEVTTKELLQKENFNFSIRPKLDYGKNHIWKGIALAIFAFSAYQTTRFFHNSYSTPPSTFDPLMMCPLNNCIYFDQSAMCPWADIDALPVICMPVNTVSEGPTIFSIEKLKERMTDTYQFDLEDIKFISKYPFEQFLSVIQNMGKDGSLWEQCDRKFRQMTKEQLIQIDYGEINAYIIDRLINENKIDVSALPVEELVKILNKLEPHICCSSEFTTLGSFRSLIYRISNDQLKKIDFEKLSKGAMNQLFNERTVDFSIFSVKQFSDIISKLKEYESLLKTINKYIPDEVFEQWDFEKIEENVFNKIMAEETELMAKRVGLIPPSQIDRLPVNRCFGCIPWPYLEMLTDQQVRSLDFSLPFYGSQEINKILRMEAHNNENHNRVHLLSGKQIMDLYSKTMGQILRYLTNEQIATTSERLTENAIRILFPGWDEGAADQHARDEVPKMTQDHLEWYCPLWNKWGKLTTGQFALDKGKEKYTDDELRWHYNYNNNWQVGNRALYYKLKNIDRFAELPRKTLLAIKDKLSSENVKLVESILNNPTDFSREQPSQHKKNNPQT